MGEKNFVEAITNLKPAIISRVTNSINKTIGKSGELDHYEIVWRQLQNISAMEIVNIIKEKFPNANIIMPKSKSTYPDIKIEYGRKLFAIDIKSNESQKDPWFDMARLDTIIQERMLPYAEEWELIIKYDSETKKFLKAYFNLFREVVGIRKECNGVKYRPYDGKLRPKSWENFDNNVIYWSTKDSFLKGIKNSQIHRWKVLIQNTLIPALNKEEKKEFKELFSN